MANKFTLLKKEGSDIYQVPDSLKLACGIQKLSISGIAFDGKTYGRMYNISMKENTFYSFENIYAYLRGHDIKYEMRLEVQTQNYYITIFSKKDSFDAAKMEIIQIDRKISSFLAKEGISLIPVDGNSLLKLSHIMVLNSRKGVHENYLKAGSWLKDFKMLDIDFKKDLSCFEKKGQFCRIYAICTINKVTEQNDSTSEHMFEELCNLDGLEYLISDFDSVSDGIVIDHMRSIYLDVDKVISRLRRKNPALYNAFVNGSDAESDSKSYTIAGMRIMLTANTFEKLKDNETQLMKLAAKDNFSVISLYGFQKEYLTGLLPCCNLRGQYRIHPTDEAIDFFPAIIKKGKESIPVIQK